MFVVMATLIFGGFFKIRNTCGHDFGLTRVYMDFIFPFK